MHSLALQLAPILGAEKSKLPFYIAGGVLVAWALFLSLVIGMRRSDFPADASQQRGVMAISAVLVLLAVSMAVVTSGGSVASQAAPVGGQSSSAAPAPQSTSTSPAAGAEAPATTKPTATKPTATTGTPAPPSSPAAGATSALTLAADAGGQLKFDTKQLSAKAGRVTITLSNASPLEHNVAVAEGAKVLGGTPTFASGSRRLTLTLKPGKYTFYCTVPGHRQAGMEGTLNVS
jgi:plastocyanin